ncbi:putative pectinesterase/pectinesterase inhibitor 46 [Morus notabilis]|uniref:Pectinesterase n=1 Tax=Morus notabilis TaxID=981085 RepID=W9S1A8_9ROSA|nr:probable pectinesterase/pectinesterase inhibitor 46 [Morus notabilis]EXC07790.1 putative pectinesterase/pectinesterase inhibitor 46 [Morus notabilis]
MSSFKAYGKFDEAEQARLEALRKTRKRVAIICVSSLILVVIVVAAVVGTTSSGRRSSGAGDTTGTSLSTSVKAVCDVTMHPDSCYSSLRPAVNSSHVTLEDLPRLSIQVAINELSKTAKYFSNLNATLGKLPAAALTNCRELLSLAMDDLTRSLSSSGESLNDVVEDLRTWLSSAATCFDTCIEGFDGDNKLKNTIANPLKTSTELTSNSLAIVTWIKKATGSFKLRRLLSDDVNNKEDQVLPEWLSSGDRRILLDDSEKLRKNADIVVAKDGTGKYKKIGDALKAVKDKNKKRTVIYVKKGIYNENVRVEKKKWNVLMVGDGMNATIVSGSLNFVDGTPTFSSATFAVFGKGFIGRDMGFRNTAGAIKHQAVALMASADQVVFYRCGVDAFQDSLYAHSNRQFYRECDIYGTVDFIFGNAAAVFQNCNILPRVPMKGQRNTLTAQGKTDPNQNTGIAIQNCTISPYGDLSSVQTYLGRPWKNYSTTVYLRSYMGSLIHPSGWLPWTGNSAPETIFYSEFENFGPGSSTKYRVKWKGLRSISLKEANKFSVTSFLQGKQWIEGAGVPHKPSI